MTITVVTTFSPRGYEVYGRRMIESFTKFWPADVKLYVYYEGETPYSVNDRRTYCDRVVWCSLDQDTDRAEFMAAHKDHPTDYRRQPVKFSHKVFAVTAAPRDTDWLIWLDGDVETTAPVTHEFLTELLPGHFLAVYLGRSWWVHSECGFVAYNMKLAYNANGYYRGQGFLDAMRRMYTSGDITRLLQQHDCAAFDHLRTTWMGAALFLDLGAAHNGPGLDVMPHTPLGAVMTHYKGPKAKRAAYGAVA